MPVVITTSALREVCLAVFILLTLAGPAYAQPQPLHESVVVTASAEPQPFETVGRAVWVLTREEIARLPVRSVEDLLRFASSVDVRARGPRVQADLSIRGASFGQTLVLVDGVRMNDAQSGHHNSDLPLTIDDVERVEVLLGAGSSLFGADALGGTVNIITRAADAGTDATAFGGAHDLAGGRVRTTFGGPAAKQSITGEVVRSSGFEIGRDFETVAASSRTAFGENTRLLVGYARKDFGARGFYGPALSHETTDQTMASVSHTFAMSSWRSSVQAVYRTHGDRFLYAPGTSENVHRTHAGALLFKASRTLGSRTRASAGAEIGGDWIGSNNLGDHRFRRASGFVELQRQVTGRLIVFPGVRYDVYSRFGDAWSPSVAARMAIRPAFSLRGSAGHAFRVPTFTELYYRDPNHQASSALTPERGWNAEVGADWVAPSHSLVRGTAFVRRDRDVIDWTRVSPVDRWETANVRRVATSGVELGVRQPLGSAGSLDLQYTWLDTGADALDGLLSKYVLEYAAHNVVVSGSARAAFGVELGSRLAWTRRNDGRSYAVVDLRASRAVGRVQLFVDAANLFDESYQEVAGVAMPGRWVSAGLRIAR